MTIPSLLRRFLPPYKYLVVLNLLFNILSTVLSLFSFATIIPVLQILFGLSENAVTHIPLESATSLQDTIAIIQNNLYYFLQTQIDMRGAQYVLIILGTCLVGLTGFKCLTAWLANYFMDLRRNDP